jgi:drug/metabolite transporter (DMT)-like permease
MSAVIQVAMNWAQKSVSPTRATLIYAGEPVWAGIVGRLAGERLPGVALLGGLLIVIAVVVSELKVRRPREKATRDAQFRRAPGRAVKPPTDYALKKLL